MDNYNDFSSNDWQSVSEVVRKEASSADMPRPSVDDKKPKPKSNSKHPVLTIQLVLCICVLLFLFLLKFMGVSAFDSIISLYSKEVNKSVIFNGNFEDLNFSGIFSTDDEA